MNRIQAGIDCLKSLLSDEQEALVTYEHALKKVGNEAEAVEIRKMRTDHVDAANWLCQVVRGEDADEVRGVWGAWSKIVVGSAKTLGTTAMLKALREGEVHEVESYEEAMAQELEPEVVFLIQSILLPQTKKHIETLNRLMNCQLREP